MVTGGDYDEVDSSRGTDDVGGGNMVQGDKPGVEGFVAVCLLVENGRVVDRGEAVDEGDRVRGHRGDRRVVRT